MKKKEIEVIVMAVLREYCDCNNIRTEIDIHTPLFGANKILDSMGLVNVIVDIETAFLDKNIEISFTSEAAMSARISPFLTVGTMCRFIAQQLGSPDNE
jgi:acyl carrier protein